MKFSESRFEPIVKKRENIESKPYIFKIVTFNFLKWDKSHFFTLKQAAYAFHLLPPWLLLLSGPAPQKLKACF